MNIAFIPVRGGSKSIPLKNIKEFCGKPLIYWTLSAACKAKQIDKVVIATDSKDIKEYAQLLHYSKVEIYDRDEMNAQDTSSTESVILEYLIKNRLNEKTLLVLIQATSPFTSSDHIDESISQYLNNHYDSLLSCVLTKRFFWNKDCQAINYDYMHRPRRQEYDGLLMENGAIYINKVKNVLTYKNRLSGKIGIYKMPEYTGLEIDEPEDWAAAEKIMHKYVFSIKPKRQIKLFITDVDGVLTDAGMYYSEKGDELKKFSTYDGKAFEILHKNGIKIAIITSESTKIVERRAAKLKVDFLFQGITDKLAIAKQLAKQENIEMDEIAFIGDDLNDKTLLEAVGFAACPINAVKTIKEISNILQLSRKGGDGAVREFLEHIIL